jgi:hypothetical protein
VRSPGNGPVDAGELAAVFFVPLPDGGGGVGGGHEGIQTRGGNLALIRMALKNSPQTNSAWRLANLALKFKLIRKSNYGAIA